MSNRPEPSKDERQLEAQSRSPNLDLLYDCAAEAIVRPVGCALFERLQASLGIIENTARWSLPRKYTKDEFSGPTLIRPLPWIFFLPALFALRMIRCTMSLILLMFGQPPLTPTVMVAFLQGNRKKLFALKNHGKKLKEQKEKEAQKKAAEQKQPGTWIRRVSQPFQYIFCFRAVRPGTAINQKPARRHRQRSERPAEAPAADESLRGQPVEQSSAKKRGRDSEDGSPSSVLPDASRQEEVDKFDSAEDNNASDASTTEFVSNDSDSDNSKTETVIVAERNKPKKIKKDVNGHATSDEKKPKPSKSSLNVVVVENSGKPEEKPSAENGKEVEQNGVLTEPVSENGVVASENGPKEEKPVETPHKPVNGTEHENTENKANNQSSPDKEQTPAKEDSAKEDNQDSSGKQSPDSIKGAKANSQQKKKQQKQQQHTAANGGGGNGKKNKKSPH